ncbi:MAG: hypothetical protein JJT94_17510 [Bernardetiaceae bacterium]|nr:hypothetical protein [Bernardetiaceae bacterium]
MLPSKETKHNDKQTRELKIAEGKSGASLMPPQGGVSIPPVQRKAATLAPPTNVVQLKKRKKNKGRKKGRKQNNKQQPKKQNIEAQNASSEQEQGWSEYLWDWASWAGSIGAEVGQGALKKAYGIDVVEIATVVRAVVRSNMSLKQKLTYLAVYGGTQAIEYISNNMADIIGGETGKLMKIQEETDKQLELVASIWENGELSEEQIESEVKDKIIDMLVGDDN